MYGLVIHALRDLVVSRHGEAAWHAALNRGEVPQTAFVVFVDHDEATTSRLIGAVADVTGTSKAEILEALGHRWLTHLSQEGYGDLLDLCGHDFLTFFRNYDAIVTRLFLPTRAIGTIECSEVTERGFVLKYRSPRPGLAPFVRGFLRGIAERCDIDLHLEHAERTERGQHCDVFVLSWRTP